MAEARGCKSSLRKLLREKQEILQGFLAPWAKAFEEWVSFAPSSLYLELKKTRDPPLQTRTRVRNFMLCLEGTKLLPPSAGSQPSHPQPSSVSSLSPCCPIPPEKPSQKQGCGIPSHPRRGWRYQHLMVTGIAFPRLSASPRSIFTSRAEALDWLLRATFTTQGFLTWRNLSSRDHLASFNEVSQHPSQVGIIISILLPETVRPKLIKPSPSRAGSRLCPSQPWAPHHPRPAQDTGGTTPTGSSPAQESQGTKPLEFLETRSCFEITR